MVRVKLTGPRELALAMIGGSVPLVCYLATLPPGLTWSYHGGDGGELMTAAATLGVPHPPGYPTYVLIGHLLYLSPGGSVAYRFNLLSAISASLVAVVLFMTLRVLQAKRRQAGAVRSYVAPLAVALALPLTRGIWQQAIITEVYTLNLLMLALLLLALAKEKPLAAGVMLGLGTTTHLTTLLIVPLWLYLLRGQSYPRAVAGVAIGLLPWLTLPLLARGDSPVVWGQLDSLRSFWWLVSARLYAPNVAALDLEAILARLSSNIVPILAQLAFVGWGILLAALADVRRNQWSSNLPYLFTAALFGIYAISYDAANAAVYALPGMILLAPILMDGLRRFDRAALLLPLILLGLNFGQVSLRDDDIIGQHGNELLTSAPANAILITPGDNTVFALWYLHHVEGKRPDITLVDANLFAFDWYRQRIHQLDPSLLGTEIDQLEMFIRLNESNRPVRKVEIPANGPPLVQHNHKQTRLTHLGENL